ncbi:acyl-CoA dehydrogenase family protein [Spirosoma luteolum]
MNPHSFQPDPSPSAEPHGGPALDALLSRIAAIAAETDHDGAFPVAAFGWLAEAGLLAVTLPGQPLDFATGQTAALLRLLKRIGSANLAVGRVYEGHINALYLIYLYATPDQRQRWYADVREKQCLFSVWNTQAHDGVRFDQAGDTVQVLGAKTFCSGAGWVQRPLITGELTGTDAAGQARRGWQMAVVPTEDVATIPADAQFWQPLGMRASASFKLQFTGITLSASDLLGQPGQYLAQPYFSGGAIRFAAVQLGGAEALYEATRRFLMAMQRTDDVLQRTRLAEVAWLIESGNQWLRSAGCKTDQWLAEGADPAHIVAYANMTRSAIEAICLQVMPLCERCVGARGLLRPQVFERIHRDLTMYLRQPAPDATLIDLGQYVLTNPLPAHDLWR